MLSGSWRAAADICGVVVDIQGARKKSLLLRRGRHCPLVIREMPSSLSRYWGWIIATGKGYRH